MNDEKINLVQQLTQAAGMDAVILNPGASFSHLTGLDFHLMERPVLLILVPGRDPALIFPALENEKVKTVSFPVSPYPYGDDPGTWSKVIKEACSDLHLEGKRIGIEPLCIRFFELDLLHEAIPDTTLTSAEALFTEIRICKTGSEIQSMQQAVEIAQQALLLTLPLIRAGETEKSIANHLVINLLHCGSQPNLPFMPIVSTGRHSADPHAVPQDTPIRPGDMLVIDWGARCGGYISDLTRTFAIEKVSDEFRRIGDIVVQANLLGCRAVRPAVTCGEIDQITRKYIAEHGYAQYFSHRTGHGIGLDPHEPPYIFSENTLALRPGMTFTVEPGVYIPGVGGIRIEDNVVVTHHGVQVLSDLPRDVQIIG